MVTKEAVAKTLLEEIYEAAESLQDQIDNPDSRIQVAVADVFCRHTHLECLVEALRIVWNTRGENE